jgi:hypothetical protein
VQNHDYETAFSLGLTGEYVINEAHYARLYAL